MGRYRSSRSGSPGGQVLRVAALAVLLGCATAAQPAMCPEPPKPCTADVHVEGMELDVCQDRPTGVRVCRYVEQHGCIGLLARLECHAGWIPAGWECPDSPVPQGSEEPPSP